MRHIANSQSLPSLSHISLLVTLAGTMATKSLSVLGNEGAGKKTLIGSLIYKVSPPETGSRQLLTRFSVALNCRNWKNWNVKESDSTRRLCHSMREWDALSSFMLPRGHSSSTVRTGPASRSMFRADALQRAERKTLLFG